MRITPLIPQAIVPPLEAGSDAARLHAEHWLHEASQVTEPQRALDRVSRFILANHASYTFDPGVLKAAEEAFYELVKEPTMDAEGLEETLSFLTFDWVRAYAPKLAASSHALQLLDMEYPVESRALAAQVVSDYEYFEVCRGLLGIPDDGHNLLDDIDGVMELTIHYPDSFSAELNRAILVGLYDPYTKTGRIITGLTLQDLDSKKTRHNKLLSFLEYSAREFGGLEHLRVLAFGGATLDTVGDETVQIQIIIERFLSLLFQPEQLEIRWLEEDELGKVVLDTVQGKFITSIE